MRFCVLLGLVGGVAHALAKEEIDTTYKSKLSLYRPYVDKISGRLVFGDLNGGCTVVSTGGDAGVHLTSSIEGSSGSITAKNPIGMRNWKMDVHMRVKPGALGVGIWIMKEFQTGEIFGGNSRFNGLMVFLALDKNDLSQEHPSIGVATAYGGSPVIHFEKRVKYMEDCVITLGFWNGTLSVLYGGKGSKPELVDQLSRVVIDDGSYMSISGQVKKAHGDITVKTISIYKQHGPKRQKYKEDEVPKTRSLMTWVVFSVLIGSVAYYMYWQRKTKPKHKGILQQ